MVSRDPQAVLQKLGQTTLKVDGFFLRRTGFVANQTILRLGDYNLNCIPATLGATEARFLAVLTPSEVSLFSKFKTGVHILILTFDDPDNHDVRRFPLRVGLADIAPVADRKNVCMLTVKLKSLPADFVMLLGDFQDVLVSQKESWEKLSDEAFDFTPELAHSVGTGFGFVLVSEETRVSVEIVSFHTKLIRIRFPDGTPPLPEASGLTLKMAFQGRPLNLEGTLGADGAFVPDFHAEWLSFVEECVFQKNLRQRVSASTGQ